MSSTINNIPTEPCGWNSVSPACSHGRDTMCLGECQPEVNMYSYSTECPSAIGFFSPRSSGMCCFCQVSSVNSVC